MEFESFRGELRRLAAAAPPLRDHGLVVLRSLGSTNSLARRIVDEYLDDGSSPPACLLIAWEQTAGRGRRGRRWRSPPGAGVWASHLVPVSTPSSLEELPLRAALGVVGALTAWGVEPAPRLKWPNDVVVDGRKAAGILVEAVHRGGATGAVVGYGVNLLPPAGREELPEAAAVSELTATPPTLAELAVGLATRVEQELTGSATLAELVDRYRGISRHRPGEAVRCRVGDEELRGTFVGFDAAGRLRLRVGDEERRLAAAEVIEG